METATRSQQASGVQQRAEFEPAEVSKMLANGTAILIDVREPDERFRTSIAGSVAMPLSTFDPEALDCDGAPLPVLHCRGGTRSLKALHRANAIGKMRVAHMKGGIDAWIAAGLPVVEDRGAPRTAMQQTQIVMGLAVLLSALAGAFLSPWILAVTCFVGCGMIFAGWTGSCAMANLIERMPWNRRAASRACPVRPG